MSGDWKDWIDLRGILVIAQLGAKSLLAAAPFLVIARVLGARTIGGEIAGAIALAIYVLMAGSVIWSQAAQLGADIYDTLGPNGNRRRAIARRLSPPDEGAK